MTGSAAASAWPGLGDRPVMMGGKNIGGATPPSANWIETLGSYEWESFGINTSLMKEDGGADAGQHPPWPLPGQQSARWPRPRDLARLAAMVARIRLDESNKFLGSKYFTGLSAKYDHEPLSAHFSTGMVNALLRPMTVRMNGAEPNEVYLGDLRHQPVPVARLLRPVAGSSQARP